MIVMEKFDETRDARNPTSSLLLSGSRVDTQEHSEGHETPAHVKKRKNNNVPRGVERDIASMRTAATDCKIVVLADYGPFPREDQKLLSKSEHRFEAWPQYRSKG